MQKIFFITITILILGFIFYMGVSALIKGRKYKEEAKKDIEKNNNNH
tara:strand:- start:380 stop:520 length:141 start_codon:yes stop_codon:yes gene_type:complete